MNYQAIVKEYSDTASIPAESMPDRLSAGVVAAGILALLLSKKSTGKAEDKAVTFSDAALIAGLAYKAQSNWQHSMETESTVSEASFSSEDILSAEYQVTLIKAMIAAARADGHINDIERQQLFKAIDKMNIRSAEKLLLLNLLRQPIKIDELAQAAKTLEQKSEIYLVSCMVAIPGQHAEKVYLAQLAEHLDIPADLADEIQSQADKAMADM